MQRPILILLCAAGLFVVTACASKPVSDPGGKWAKQAEMIDNSLFQ
ncbi:hypothetical protein [Jiella sonneratiae]|uniref:Uncharacterized protein n=1 Tax=Jiella sonneratiae TaxID=2816856 RepID=A0ABS3J2E8_9HYPH|nr:hypothetical protein [Jiella sonneratiae]MBO0903856.1 hypothetical protein [Jiella sonneratiae]